MWPRLILTIAVVLSGFNARAAVLQRLSMDDMIAQSTDIVHARVIASTASFRGTPGRGGMIYTHYTVTVLDRMKGPSSSSMDVAVPGGTSQGLRQTFAGAPTLTNGQEYVLFLWTSRSGLTQVIGLTQGLFDIHVDASGTQFATRIASSEIMIDPANGQTVPDTGVRYNLGALTKRIQKTSLQALK
jgi:hypothetical protein